MDKNERKKNIVKLYNNILHRKPRQQEIRYFLYSKFSLYDIQLKLWHSKEFKQKIEDRQKLLNDGVLDNDLVPYILNLPRRVDRKLQIERQLENLGISNYKIIDSIDAKDFDTFKNIYNHKKAVAVHRALAPSEIATTLSHLRLYEYMLRENKKYLLIMEDDALLTQDFKDFLRSFDTTKEYKFELLMLGSISPSCFDNGKVKLHDAYSTLIEKNSIIYLDEPLLSIGDFLLCKPKYPSFDITPILTTHAYIITLSAAKKLANFHKEIFCPVDLPWNIGLDIELLMLNKVIVYQTPTWQDSDALDRENLYHSSMWKNISHIDWGT